jgi:hypothetical protein
VAGLIPKMHVVEALAELSDGGGDELGPPRVAMAMNDGPAEGHLWSVAGT